MSIAFSWQGLPQFAARQLRPAIAQFDQACPVIGTRPEVPIQGMEAALGQPIHWVEAAQSVRWADLGLAVPKVFFQAGWGCQSFNTLGDEVRAAGGKVCLQMDSCWRGDLRQWLGGLWFRAFPDGASPVGMALPMKKSSKAYWGRTQRFSLTAHR